MQALLLMAMLLGQPEANKPVIAVFPIDDRRNVLTPEEIGQITDYFGVKITETQRFIVVPRADIESALRAKQVESYAECFDESCQIEIGKQLAAEKVLHTQIVKIGQSCAVTSTLYDLRLSATEQAASEKTACDSDALVAALEAVAARLATSGSARPPPKAAPPPVAAPAPKSHKLRIDSVPRRAEVLVQGSPQGTTPMVIDLPAKKPQTIEVRREGYEPRSETVSLERDRQLRFELSMTAEQKRSRIEWFGLSVGVGATSAGSVDLSFWLRFFNLHFGSFAVTLLELAGGPIFIDELTYFDGCEDEPFGYCTESELLPKLYLGPRVGYKLTFGEDHNIELGVGGGFFTTFDPDVSAPESFTGASVSPRIAYQYLGAGKFSWGVALRAIVPIGPRDCVGELDNDDLTEDHVTYAVCKAGPPVLFQLEIPIGWYF